MAKVTLADAAPMARLALRFAAAIAIVTVLFAILRPPLSKTSKDWLHLGFVGFLMQPLYFGMAYFAFVNGVTASTAALIFSLQPLLVALLAPQWRGEAASWPQWLGLAIAIAITMTGTFVVITTHLEIGPPPMVRFGFAALACRINQSRKIWSATARDCSDCCPLSTGLTSSCGLKPQFLLGLRLFGDQKLSDCCGFTARRDPSRSSITSLNITVLVPPLSHG